LDGGSARRKAAIYTQNKRRETDRQTDMSRVESKPTILVFERAKTFHVLDRSANVIGLT
jgi:hypothetical protein